MEDVLSRLWELSSALAAPHTDAELTEAQHVWKTLETVIATLKVNELRVQDGPFSKLLACVRVVLQDPAHWSDSAASTPRGKSALILANRVLVKLGCRGEEERDAVIREGFVDLLVDSLGAEGLEFNGAEAASILQVIQTLAFDTKHRHELLRGATVSVTLATMRRYPRELSVQLYGCKFLQFMAYEEASKEQIVQHEGIATVLDALTRFGADVQLVVSASDVLYFLSLDLESTLAHNETKFVSTMEAIMEHVVKVLQRHVQVEQIQVHGIAILLSFVSMHSDARQFLCDHAAKTLWELAAGALEASGDTTSDTVDLMETLLDDPDCYNALHKALLLELSPQDASDQMRMLQGVSLLKARLENQRTSHHAFNARTMGFVLDRLQTLLDCSRTGAPSPRKQGPSFAMEDEGDEIILNGAAPVKNADLTLRQRETEVDIDDEHDDDSRRYLDNDSPSRRADGDLNCDDEEEGGEDDEEPDAHSVHSGDSLALLSPSTGRVSGVRVSDDSIYMVNSPNYTTTKDPLPTSVSRPPSTPTTEPSGQSMPHWQHQLKAATLAERELQGEYRLLQHNYQIVVRRAQEQSKLLNIQNARIRHHMDAHQRVLERVRTLETALEDATRKHQVERELRLAEVAQSEKISFSLHEAMTEIKTLNTQNSNATRERLHTEKLRVDYQQRASSIKQQRQQLENERDDAVLQVRAIEAERAELGRRLAESRREAAEALRMREEDVDAPKPSVFSELLQRRCSPTAASRVRKVSNYTLTTKKVGADILAAATSMSQTHHSHRKSMYAGSYTSVIRPVDASVMRKASLCGGQVLLDRAGNAPSSNNLNLIDIDEVDAEGELMAMSEPKDDSAVPRAGDAQSHASCTSHTGLSNLEIEHTLRAAYEALEASTDGVGVHLATVRRFFIDCGIVAPPLVPGDVDTILAKVLSQAQENRKRVIVRKDFSVVPLTGSIGSGNGNDNGSGLAKVSATDAKRFRFFDEEAFFESITLLGMRRYPRLDVKKVLETFITDHLHPMQRQARRASSSGSATTLAPSRSGSFGSTIGGGGGSGSASSPTAVCIGVLKAVLNGLALHVGRDDGGHDDPRFLTKQDNHHNSLLLASGATRARKHKREDVVYSMLEMHAVLAREYKPLATICEFYSAMHHTPRDLVLKDETVLPLSFELVLTFAMDFEIIPSFMDRLSLKHLYSEVGGLVKTYFSLHKKFAHATDAETLKKVAFSMMLARLAMELFSAKRDYETPEKQATALLQWLDNSVGREKIMKKAMLPIVIKFSRKLYALKA